MHGVGTTMCVWAVYFRQTLTNYILARSHTHTRTPHSDVTTPFLSIATRVVSGLI